jgi:hypothetical protein
MTLQAYLDNIEAKTGKTTDDFRVLAEEKGLLGSEVKPGRILAWLKEDFGLGHGHAMAIVHVFKAANEPKASLEEQVARHFTGNKAGWRKAYDELFARASQFGPDVAVSPTNTYLSLLRNRKKFGVVHITSNRLDIGIKLNGVKSVGRLNVADGSWKNMVTHRVQVSAPQQIDEEVLAWLKEAYEASGE